MAESLRVLGDPARAVKDFLAAALPPVVSGVDPSVGLVLPSDWTVKSVPHVGVFDDGGPVLWPVVASSRVRVTVWASGRSRAREIASLAMGLVLVRRVPGVAVVRDPSSILDAFDEHNGGQMASFTVQAKARTIAV